MMLALVAGQRRTAEPAMRGQCPACDGEAIAKCGPVNAWHWAHRAADCDTWAEPFTQWHTDWQDEFPDEFLEVVIGNHRADVRLPNGGVIEFQHSALSADEIHEREKHYGRMLWVFDTTDAFQTDRLNLRRRAAVRNGRRDLAGHLHSRYRSFRWKHPRRSILACRRPVYLDLGDGLLELKKMYPTAPYGGWGYLISVDEFLDRLRECVIAELEVS